MRAQSHVIGAVLMLGLAVVALGALTLAVGTVLETQAANTDAERVATTMDDALHGVERTGHYSHRVTFAEGQLSTVERSLRVIDGNGTVMANVSVDAVLYEGGDRRVVGLAGAVVRGQRGSAWLASDPPITGSERNAVLAIGAPVVGANDTAITGTGGVTVDFVTNVSHSERGLGTGEFTIAIETATPEPFERFFAEQNATVERRQFSGDSHVSVVAEYPGQRRAYLVVHDLALVIES